MALAVAGLVLARRDAGRRAGLLLALAGVLWSAPDWTGWEAGPDLVRSLAELGVPAVLALALLALVSERTRELRVLAGGVLALVAARALVRDPFLAADCWRNCSAGSFAVLADADWGARLHDAARLAAPALAAGVVLHAARRRDPVALATAALAVTLGAQELARVGTDVEDPARAGFAVLHALSSAAALALAGTAVAAPVRAARARRALRRLARDLAGGEPVLDTLARRLGDPTVQIAFPYDGGFCDERGDPAPEPGGAGRAVVALRRGTRTVAAIEVREDVAQGLDFQRALGGAALLAVENAGRRAALEREARVLAEVRRRIVADSDAARRRLERDLHDGAQQALVGLLLDLRIAADPGWSQAVTELEAAVDELRGIAVGIHPAVLTRAGVAAAVEELLDSAVLPLETAVAPVRFSEPAELAAYRLFAAVARAPGRGARLQLELDQASVVAVAEHTGGGAPLELAEIEDRVAALGGALEVHREGPAVRVVARMPAS